MSSQALAGPDLNEQLRAIVAGGSVPGLVVMAGNRTGTIFSDAYGQAEAGAGRAMTVDRIFRIASMTKAVTAVAAVQLIEEGRLALDEPAAKYVPELAHPLVLESLETAACRLRPAASPITVRQLFTHTSGLGYSFTSPRLRDFKPREGEAPPVGPLLFDPGTQWLYGTSTDMLGKVIVAITGENLEDYFRRRIFGPLGMHDTAYNVPIEKQARIVNVHRRIADGSLVEQPREAPARTTNFGGGGGLYSTAGDYLRFLRMLLNGGELDGAKVLAPESVALMGRNHLGNVELRAIQSALPERSRDFSFIADRRDQWGLGFQITTAPEPGMRAPGSLSWGGIFNTYFWLDPTRGIAGVILMQFLPFADEKALALYGMFERGVYELARP